jgi:hypothetical protein
VATSPSSLKKANPEDRIVLSGFLPTQPNLLRTYG